VGIPTYLRSPFVNLHLFVLSIWIHFFLTLQSCILFFISTDTRKRFLHFFPFSFFKKKHAKCSNKKKWKKNNTKIVLYEANWKKEYNSPCQRIQSSFCCVCVPCVNHTAHNTHTLYLLVCFFSNCFVRNNTISSIFLSVLFVFVCWSFAKKQIKNKKNK